MGIVRVKDIDQGFYGTCAALAMAPDNLLFHRKKHNKIAFKFYDRDTGLGEWVSIKAPLWRKEDQHSAAYNSSRIIERSYSKWIEREKIVDESGQTGFASINNGNFIPYVSMDFTGIALNQKLFVASHSVRPMQRLSPSSALATTQDSTYFVNNHAYRVLGVTAESITIFNPWRIDGMAIVGKNDGFITLSRGEFMADFKGWFYV